MRAPRSSPVSTSPISRCVIADRACLLSGNGESELVDCAALGTDQLGRLYGIRYVETRLGQQRFMAPG